MSPNAMSPINVTLSGIVILVSSDAPLKASEPIYVTVLGIMTLVSKVAIANASLERPTTPFGMFAVPSHVIPLLTTLLVIVKVPLIEQFTSPSGTAWASGEIESREANSARIVVRISLSLFKKIKHFSLIRHGAALARAFTHLRHV